MFAAIPLTEDVAEVATPREIRATDVSKLSFPIQIVIAIVVSAVSASGTIWMTQRGNEKEQAAMRSDIRDVLTRMQGQSDLDAANRRLQELQTNQMKESIDELRRQTQLLEIQYRQLAALPKGR